MKHDDQIRKVFSDGFDRMEFIWLVKDDTSGFEY